MKKKRLDVMLVDNTLVESRSLAQRLIMAGQVRVAGQVIYKPATMIEGEPEITIEELPKYVSRGAEKLEGALHGFGLTDLQGLICADAGASTGGFTDCLLTYGAARVYALDVGQNILHWKLRNDERVVVMEGTNVRNQGSLPEAVDMVVIDVSFISLEIVLPVVRGWLKDENRGVVALIKPQFEAGRKEAARGKGVIRDARVHRDVLERTLQSAVREGYSVNGLIRSPLKGPKGNIEFLVYLHYPGDGVENLAGWIERAMSDSGEEDDVSN